MVGCSPTTNRLHLVGSVGAGSFSSLVGSQFFSAEKEFPLLFLLCNPKQFKFVYLICVSELCWTPRDGHKGLGGHFFFARSRLSATPLSPTGEWGAEGVVPWGSPCSWQGPCPPSFLLWGRLVFLSPSSVSEIEWLNKPGLAFQNPPSSVGRRESRTP